jgi:hypothetical protein
MRAGGEAGVRPRRPTGRLSGFVVIRDLSYTCTTKPRTTSRTGRDAPPPEWVREARAKGGGEGRLADSSERGRSMGEWAKASAGNHDRAPCYSRPGWVQVAMARRRRQWSPRWRWARRREEEALESEIEKEIEPLFCVTSDVVGNFLNSTKSGFGKAPLEMLHQFSESRGQIY